MLGFANPDRRIRELEYRIADQKTVAASLARNGFMGAAAEVLVRVGKLQMRLEARRRDAKTQRQAG